ncbi:hypothetical protein ASPZODRAFT_1964515 [Penicilliopsis zonata CBS 506.65]|uniref:LysM domain-containing protein n=1 Tax=Penicilliopsis zonata CBS 506.65 TaxID=1073090 RepID=A0A1L9SH53_9EURO|nr:hypothetical protein ASPZODRAFT_1964515 [Penicilliopsis zonata CBS 506.65]OJJ46481.1 hypothetical protein ASPZODRAFT_1964515 [Penicilliopsis zonata CBS 506.65]
MSSTGALGDSLRTSAAASSSATTSRRSASTVRPRTRRLISFNDDDDNDNNPYCSDGYQSPASGLSTTLAASELTPPRSRGATPLPYTSRGASPMPMRHPSRATEVCSQSGSEGWDDNVRVPSLGRAGIAGGDRAKLAAGQSRPTMNLFDASWSSLQSLASSVLGSDVGGTSTNGDAMSHRRRKPLRSDNHMTSTPKQWSTSPSTWGPTGLTSAEIGAGTREERQALVQAKKREALLLADTGLTSTLKRGHKRRDSTEQPDQAVVDPGQDGETLVYVHRVHPTDSITGVTIKYGCQAAIFRKSNGFWPSDSIQSRKTVLLPVDACSVKGRPIRSTPADLLTHDSSGYMNGSSIAPGSTADTTLSTTTTESEADRTWKHESWVQIDGFPAAVEIGRVPRMTLGFFPRTRRKSFVYSDSEASLTPLRERPESPAPPPSLPRNNLPTGVLTSTKPSPGIRHQRQRSNFQLTGPGVGTLDRTAIAPGPAPDGLNNFFAQHLPTFGAPPPPNQSRTSSDSTSTVLSHTTTTSLDNLGGVLEGWVRNIATKAKAGLNDLQSGVGDLIEMDDAPPPPPTSPPPPPLDAQRQPIQTAARFHSNQQDSFVTNMNGAAEKISRTTGS